VSVEAPVSPRILPRAEHPVSRKDIAREALGIPADMRLITHHCGAMIPFFAGRAETLWAQLGSRSADENYDEILKRMSKKPIEYFKMFYADTVLGGSASALRCGLDFFGADKIVFASDCPFDPEGGPMFIREGMRSIEDLNLSETDKRKIYFGNALRLMRMPQNLD